MKNPLPNGQGKCEFSSGSSDKRPHLLCHEVRVELAEAVDLAWSSDHLVIHRRRVGLRLDHSTAEGYD
jgi:hypothetical protein